MSISKKTFGLLGLAFGLAACGHKLPDYRNISDAAVVADGGVLVSATAGEASKLNPYLFSDSASADISSMIFNSLLRYSPKLELEGELAQSWTVKDGGKTIIFKLKPGVKWQDGVAFSSADVKFTIDSILDPKVASPRKSDYELIDKIETPDPLTVVVHYKKAFAPALATWGIGIAPKHLLEGKDVNTDPFNRQPIGTGPYRLTVWKDKQYVELEANPDYFEGKVHIAKVRIRFIPEAATQFLELKTGGIDSMTLQPEQYLYQTDGDDFSKVNKKYRFDGLNTYSYLAFNQLRQPFNDKRVRQALSYAIDRQELIAGVMEGLAKPCSGPYSPLMPAYNHAVKPYPYDLTKSAQLLDSAGWKLGKDGIRAKGGKQFKFSLITNQGNEPRKKTALILQQQFQKLGVLADVQVIEWSSLQSNYIDKKNFDTVVMGWQLDLDPDQYSIWHSSQTKDGELNFISYKNPVVDKLLEQGREEFNPAKRLAIYRQFHAVIADDQPLAFLYAPDSLSALSGKVQGILETPTGMGWYSNTRWYIPASVQQ
jgi:peptide/nickel transport system substrate-binding protein